uniref:Uncharacterized protein n=1 Tax=Oryza barthii TaxID=65489 RepID=A0A0D3HI00_9ORYZ
MGKTGTSEKVKGVTTGDRAAVSPHHPPPPARRAAASPRHPCSRLPQSVAALSSLSTQPKEPKASLAPPAPPLATTGAARLFLLGWLSSLLRKPVAPFRFASRRCGLLDGFYSSPFPPPPRVGWSGNFMGREI